MKDKYYKRPGGVIALPRAMLRSDAYRSLSLVARCLIVELQNRWAPDRAAINLSVREVATLLSVGLATASEAFRELENQGFIELATPADHGGRKARAWSLTWQPVNGHEPADLWRIPKNLAFGYRNAKAVCVSEAEREITAQKTAGTRKQ